MAIQKKDFNDHQQNVFLEALGFVLNIDKKANQLKLDYLRMQAFEMGYDLRKLKTKSSLKDIDVISRLNSIKDIRIRRYILREMIMLAIADHELSDTEVDTIYNIGTKVGITVDKIDDFFLWAAKGVEWQIESVKLVEEDL